MTVRAFEYDANDRLLKKSAECCGKLPILYSWDANGSLLSRVAGGAYPDERRYTWDAETGWSPCISTSPMQLLGPCTGRSSTITMLGACSAAAPANGGRTS